MIYCTKHCGQHECPDGNPANCPRGWDVLEAWHYQELLRIPDHRVEVQLTDELVPLNWYGYIVAVKRDGEFIGWADKDDCRRNTHMSHFSTGCTTRYCGPTNHRGARVIARHILSGKRATVSWDDGLDTLQNHERAAIKLLNPTWDVEVTADVLIHGSTDSGYVFLIGRPLRDKE